MAGIDLTKLMNPAVLGTPTVDLIDPSLIAGIGTVGISMTGGTDILLNLGSVIVSPSFAASGNILCDPLWRDNGSGQISVWQLSGTTVAGAGAIGVLDSSWTFLGIGAFTGTGANDVLWRNSSGLIYEWQLNGTVITGGGAIGNLDSSWSFLGVGGFDGNGDDDVLWRNSSGLIYEWQMNGTAIAGGGAIGVLDSGWTFLGVGNFEGNGDTDILWQDAAGLIYEWQMNGTTVAGGGAIGVLDPTAWTFLGVGDFDGKGNDDLVWRNTASGLIYEWQMAGTAITGGGGLGIVSSGMSLLAIGALGTVGTSPLAIAGTTSGQLATDLQTLTPFATVTVTDQGGAVPETATITMLNSGTVTGADGALTGAGLSLTATGVYTLSAPSAAALTTALDALLFTPTRHQVPQGQTVTTGFSIAVTDSIGFATSDSATSVAVQSGTVAPTITGALAGQVVTAPGAIQPFGSVTINDGNPGQTETVTVTLSAPANGVLSNLGGGAYNSATGVWSATGSATQVTAALEGLVFTPTASLVTAGAMLATSATIATTDTAGATASDATTSIYAEAAPSGTGFLIEAGYYDLAPSYGNPNPLPVPWIGAPLTTFDGDPILGKTSDPDESGFLIANTGTAPLVLTAASFTHGGGSLTPWNGYIGSGQTIQAGGFLILTGTPAFNMDGSEVGIGGGTLTATINGTPITAVDASDILYGWPAYDETLPWTTITSGSVAGPVTCFAEGTLIRTSDGDVAIEHLTQGESVLTSDGRSEPVVWIGRRQVDCRAHQQPGQVWPVRVAKGAFGDGRPARDLWLSPDHAVFIDGVLVPVRLLMDGALIAQVPVDAVTYYHVELPAHEVILAEGLAVESYLDVGDRWRFENGAGAVSRFPASTAKLWEGCGCAPLVLTGPPLAQARRALARAA